MRRSIPVTIALACLLSLGMAGSAAADDWSFSLNYGYGTSCPPPGYYGGPRVIYPSHPSPYHGPGPWYRTTYNYSYPTYRYRRPYQVRWNYGHRGFYDYRHYRDGRRDWRHDDRRDDRRDWDRRRRR